MPRQGRINYSGALHHVMVRGLERCKIFRDDKDRKEFLSRLEIALEKSGTKCYGWALMPNHVHLIIRTGEQPLSALMCKLLTGYAIYFNGRHRRRGYLYESNRRLDFSKLLLS